MILGNLAKAVREQNYFAVFLEFLIVIAGVVIGFQINDAAQQRARSAYVNDVLLRLHAEVVQMEDQGEFYQDRVTESLTVLEEAWSIIMKPAGAETFSEAHCFHISVSDTIFTPSDELPSLDELLASGGLELVVRDELRDAIMTFTSLRSVNRAYLERTYMRVVSIPKTFPRIVRFDLVETAAEAQERLQTVRTCDVAAMQASPEFQAALFDNIDIRQHNAESIIGLLGSRLDDLHAAIDLELGLVHNSD